MSCHTHIVNQSPIRIPRFEPFVHSIDAGSFEQRGDGGVGLGGQSVVYGEAAGGPVGEGAGVGGVLVGYGVGCEVEGGLEWVYLSVGVGYNGP